MSAHTPGPWQRNGHVVYVLDRGQGFRFSALVSAGPAHMNSETDANARLIVSAPELLAACKRALVDLDGCDSVSVQILRDAIEKAGG